MLALLILAGCGGSGAPKAQSQAVTGNGFRFDAPAGWKITRLAQGVNAARDSELVQVSSFPLVHAYSDALFAKVAGELEQRMQAVAAETGGKVAPAHTVTSAGIRSHSYDVDLGDHVDQYTFVLRGKREFQLLCRRRSSSSSSFCVTLIRSFAPA